MGEAKPGSLLPHFPSFSPWQSKLLHFDRQLKNVVNALALGLCLVHVVTPHVASIVSIRMPNPIRPRYSHPMSPNQDRIAIRVLVHSLF